MKEYKYLSKTSEGLSKQANKTLFSLMKQLSNLLYPKPSLMCHLFDSLIKPVMNYGAEYFYTRMKNSIAIINWKIETI